MKGVQITSSRLSRKIPKDHNSTGGYVLTILALAMCLSVVPAISERQATPVPTKAEHDACLGTPYTEECVSSLTTHRTSANSNNRSQESSFLIAALRSSFAAIQDFQTHCDSNLSEISDTKTCLHSALGMCVRSLESAGRYLNSSISHLELLTESESMHRIEEVLTWLSASMTYHTTCMDETSRCSSVEDLNVSLAHGNTSMVRATNSVSMAWAMLQNFSSPMSSEVPNRRPLAAPALDESPVYDTDGDYPQWMRVGVRNLLQASVNSISYNTTVAKDGSGNHSTVQAAVDAAPAKSNTSYIIRIQQGVYNELVNVPSSAYNVMFLGDGINKTIITGNLSVQGNAVTTFKTATVGN